MEEDDSPDSHFILELNFLIASIVDFTFLLSSAPFEKQKGGIKTELVCVRDCKKAYISESIESSILKLKLREDFIFM